LVLPSCGYLQGLEQNKKLDAVSQALQDVDAELETLKRIQAEARAKADLDGDGKLSAVEKMNYLSLIIAGSRLRPDAARRRPSTRSTPSRPRTAKTWSCNSRRCRRSSMRNRKSLAVLALLLCGGCASVLPNTAAAIAPATIPDMLVGLGADVENLLSYLMILLGI
jgi:hypothetical protein